MTETPTTKPKADDSPEPNAIGQTSAPEPKSVSPRTTNPTKLLLLELAAKAFGPFLAVTVSSVSVGVVYWNNALNVQAAAMASMRAERLKGYQALFAVVWEVQTSVHGFQGARAKFGLPRMLELGDHGDRDPPTIFTYRQFFQLPGDLRIARRQNALLLSKEVQGALDVFELEFIATIPPELSEESVGRWLDAASAKMPARVEELRGAMTDDLQRVP